MKRPIDHLREDAREFDAHHGEGAMERELRAIAVVCTLVVCGCFALVLISGD